MRINAMNQVQSFKAIVYNKRMSEEDKDKVKKYFENHKQAVKELEENASMDIYASASKNGIDLFSKTREENSFGDNLYAVIGEMKDLLPVQIIKNAYTNRLGYKEKGIYNKYVSSNVYITIPDWVKRKDPIDEIAETLDDYAGVNDELVSRIDKAIIANKEFYIDLNEEIADK